MAEHTSSGSSGSSASRQQTAQNLHARSENSLARWLAGWLAGWLAYRRMAVRNPLGAPMAGAVTVEVFQQPAHVLVEVKAEVWLQPSPLVELQKLKYTCEKTALF